MKKIPSIHQPIQKSDGSMEYVWYLFLQWVSENAGKVDLSDYFTKEETEALLALKADTDDLANVAFTGDYDDLTNKPTIPTVGDGTITVKQGGVTKGTFTVNQSGNTELNLDKGGDIDNLTITENADDEMQAIGVINKNAEMGATNPIYDWVGTEAEYEAQNIATLHPEWLCFITDDCVNTQPVHTEVAERNMGELVYSTIPITDAGLHLADGELLDGNGIYADFYDYMVGVYNAGHTSIFCSEADWQTSNTNYGKCGKYVLDTINHTIRLPKIPGFVEGTLTEAEIGDLVEAGAPNITGSFYHKYNNTAIMFGAQSVGTGALYYEAIGTSNLCQNSSGSYAGGAVAIDASRSSPIYGNSTTVQPESIKVYVYVVIANTVKVPVQVDIDNIATELNACYGHRVVEFQLPTADNNYTWYRKYADGWVEQGGKTTQATTAQQALVLLVAMADANYQVLATVVDDNLTGYVFCVQAKDKTTTGFKTQVYGSYQDGIATSGYNFDWEVKGIAAS